MSVDRTIYLSSFHKGSQPEWVCPTCNRGILKGVVDNFRRTEVKTSRDAHHIPDWEPEWITYIYSSQFQCTNSKCEEIVESIGTGSVETVVDFDNEKGYTVEYYDIFTPTYFTPHLNIFKISPNTPSDVKASINKSFAIFFINPSAAANQTRIALEQLLDHLKVKKYETTKGKRHLLSLHKRIGFIPNKVSDLKELFMAIKWLGNDASHVEGVEKKDVMDVYDIFESILDEIFGQKTEGLRKLAKKINQRRNS